MQLWGIRVLVTVLIRIQVGLFPWRTSSRTFRVLGLCFLYRIYFWEQLVPAEQGSRRERVKLCAEFLPLYTQSFHAGEIKASAPTACRSLASCCLNYAAGFPDLTGRGDGRWLRSNSFVPVPIPRHSRLSASTRPLVLFFPFRPPCMSEHLLIYRLEFKICDTLAINLYSRGADIDSYVET